MALQVAEQMSNYLLTGAVENALNMPSVTAEEAKVMGPWIKLADHLGAFLRPDDRRANQSDQHPL